MQSLRAMRGVGVRASLVGQATGVRAFSSNISGGSMGKAWADKEHAAENQYFNQKDAETLAKLASKLKNHTAPTPESIAQEKEALLAIFAKYETTASEGLLDELVKFKFNH